MAAFQVQMSRVHYEERKDSVVSSIPVVEDEGCGLCGCVKFLSTASQERARLQKERIKQYSIWRYEVEEQKAVEYIRRRHRRSRIRDSFNNLASIKYLRCCYTLFFILFSAGVLFTLCSCVKTIGKGTPFYDQRDLYRILGPILLTFSLVVYCIIDAILSVLKRKLPQSEGLYVKEKKVSSSKRQEGNVHETSDQTNENDNRSANPSSFSESNRRQGFIDRLHSTVSTSDKIKRWQKTSRWVNISEDSGCSDLREEEVAAAHSDVEGQTYGPPVSQSPTRFVYERQLSRNASSKSKASTTSQFSDFSESAPLVKRK